MKEQDLMPSTFFNFEEVCDMLYGAGYKNMPATPEADEDLEYLLGEQADLAVKAEKENID